VNALTRIPGIGTKGAKKMILDVSGKLSRNAKTSTNDVSAEVLGALVELGWNSNIAKDAVNNVAKEFNYKPEKKDMPEMLRAALKLLGTK
jgi:Holliday junction DNA helicase RuvA